MSNSNRDLFEPKKIVISDKYKISVSVRNARQEDLARHKARVVRLYETHKSYSLVAEIMGYKDTRTIRRALHSVGYPVISNQNIVHIENEVLDEVIDRIDQGEKIIAVAKELNINPSTMKAKIKRRKKELLEGELTADDKNELLKQFLIGQSRLGCQCPVIPNYS